MNEWITLTHITDIDMVLSSFEEEKNHIYNVREYIIN